MKLAGLGALLAAAYGILGNGAISASSPYVNGNQIATNLKQNWLLYLGIPLAVGVAGSVAKGMHANPGVSLGSVRVRVF